MRLTKRDAVGRSRISASPSADHIVLTSGPFPGPVPMPAPESDRPLWTAWTLPITPLDYDIPPDPTGVLLAHLVADRSLIAGARVDYQRTRIAPDPRFSGRAKITISLADPIGQAHLPAALSELCERVRHEVINTLVRQGVPLRNAEFTLDWRERWVGQTITT